MELLIFNHFDFKSDSCIWFLPNTKLTYQSKSVLSNCFNSFYKGKIYLNKTYLPKIKIVSYPHNHEIWQNSHFESCYYSHEEKAL